MSGISAIFDAVSFTPPKKSTFDGSHDIKTSCKIGDVFPLDVVPVYPSDNFRMQYTSQAKFSPLVAPAFARMSLKQWSFFVRNADLWEDFQEFVSGVNPKAGKTAYNESYSSDLVHPYFTKNGFFTGRFVVKLNLANVDLDKITVVYDSNNLMQEIRIDTAYINSLILAMKSQENLVTIEYHKGDKIKMLYHPEWFNAVDKSVNFMRFRSEIDRENGYYKCRLNTFADKEDFSAKSETWYGNDVVTTACVPSFDEPGDLLDYLGYPVEDRTRILQDEELVKKIVKTSNALSTFFRKYYDLSSSLGYTDGIKYVWNGQKGAYGASLETDITHADFNNSTSDWTVSDFYSSDGFVSVRTSDDSFTALDRANATGVLGRCSLFGILARYLIWCKFTNNTSTMTSEAPYFDFVSLSDVYDGSDETNIKMDSLRWRAYWKVWNDYFRHPNLTYEVPITYSLGGDDLQNIAVQIGVVFASEIAKGTMYDWRGRNWLDSKMWSFFPDVESGTSTLEYISGQGSNAYGGAVATVLQTRLCYELFRPFKHLRERDYITGCLPNTSVVDVVAPIMPSSALDAYGEKPWTNDPMSADGKSHDNTAIDPVRATEDAYTANVGWLDIENLRITQKLKEYFVSLRHTLGSFKDYVKVFFGADISDLTLHRAEFLGGSSQNVNVSELVSSSQSDNLPQGSLAGRANSFGQSGVVDKFVNDYGFIVTLECLSPLEINVGGLSRQLIRDTRFDYFNPKFAELGDMAVTKKEICAAPILKGSSSSSSWYDEIFGYTPRYMDLKYIPSSVHGDFLGSLSDWHLDLIQSPINDLSVELSQAWLEENSTDRIFSEIYDDSSNCFIWCECRCVYQRALPAISYEVIG